MALPVAPQDLSQTSVNLIGCMFSLIMYIIVLSIPVLLLFVTFMRFITARKSMNREYAEQEFIEEILSSIIYSFFIAIFIFVIFAFANFWGVPIEKIIHQAFQVGDLFPKYNLNTCPNQIKNHIQFFLSIASAVLRLVLTLAPIVSLVYIFIRRMSIAHKVIQRGQGEAIGEYMKATVYAGFLGLAILVLITTTLKIIGVSYTEVASSTLGAIITYIKTGG